MPPVRIKYYGIFPMTKRTYLLALALSGFLAVAILTVVTVLGLVPPLDTLWSRAHHAPGMGIWVLIHNYMWWVIVICLVAQVFDTWITLRVFAKKEAEALAAEVSKAAASESIMEKKPQ